ncbi:hypothetical protein SRABI128_04368 [Microbacterium sp. Bi128]|nr:hypothetical protein SRABI128_04368 [Microbacterium sp. Bi128]
MRMDCAVGGADGETSRLRIHVGHENVAVGADLGGVVEDAAGQFTRPPHGQCRQRHGQDGVEPARGSARTRVRGGQQVSLRVVEDHFHAKLPGREGQDHRLPVRGQVQAQPHARFGVEFVLQQVGSLRDPVVQHAARKFNPFRIGAVPGQPGRRGLAGPQRCHQVDCRNAHALILPRLLSRPINPRLRDVRHPGGPGVRRGPRRARENFPKIQ